MQLKTEVRKELVTAYWLGQNPTICDKTQPMYSLEPHFALEQTLICAFR